MRPRRRRAVALAASRPCRSLSAEVVSNHGDISELLAWARTPSVRPNVLEVVSGPRRPAPPLRLPEVLGAVRGTLIDVSTVLPESSVFYYKNPDGTNRSVAALTNLFRYCLLEKKGGWWFDTDVLRLDAPLPCGEVVLGKEDDVLVCNAIIKAPVGHPVIVQAKRRALAAGTDLTWGQTGTNLLTALAAELGMAALVEPRGILPICPQQYALPATAEGRSELTAVTKSAPLRRSFGHAWPVAYHLTARPYYGFWRIR